MGCECMVIRDGVKRILKIIDDASQNFGEHFLEEVCFSGSVYECVKDQKVWSDVGDVDIVIVGDNMAQNYWRFLKILLEKGIHPVWDVCNVPEEVRLLWCPCNRRFENPTSLTLDCSENLKFASSADRNSKQYNLDLDIDRRVIGKVPHSEKWMYCNYACVGCDDPRVSMLHDKFLSVRKIYDDKVVKYRDAVNPIQKVLTT